MGEGYAAIQRGRATCYVGDGWCLTTHSAGSVTTQSIPFTYCKHVMASEPYSPGNFSQGAKGTLKGSGHGPLLL